MTLEFISKRCADTPAILISDLEPQSVAALRDAASRLSAERDQEILAGELPGVTGKNGCALMMTNVEGRPGVRRIGTHEFRWVQDREGLAQVAELIDPFLEPQPASFQFLESGDLNVIISTDGTW